MQRSAARPCLAGEILRERPCAAAGRDRDASGGAAPVVAQATTAWRRSTGSAAPPAARRAGGIPKENGAWTGAVWQRSARGPPRGRAQLPVGADSARRWWRFFPAARASSDVNSWARPLAWAVRPPMLAISRTRVGSMTANPRFARGRGVSFVVSIMLFSRLTTSTSAGVEETLMLHSLPVVAQPKEWMLSYSRVRGPGRSGGPARPGSAGHAGGRRPSGAVAWPP